MFDLRLLLFTLLVVYALLGVEYDKRHFVSSIIASIVALIVWAFWYSYTVIIVCGWVFVIIYCIEEVIVIDDC